MKDFILRQLGKRYKTVDFLKRNKVLVGVLFYAGCAYVLIFGCPGAEGYISCDKLALVLANVGSFLTGAGLIPSDYREKFVQGRIDPLDLIEEKK
jgi:hypothetical protein